MMRATRETPIAGWPHVGRPAATKAATEAATAGQERTAAQRVKHYLQKKCRAVSAHASSPQAAAPSTTARWHHQESSSGSALRRLSTVHSEAEWPWSEEDARQPVTWRASVPRPSDLRPPPPRPLVGETVATQTAPFPFSEEEPQTTTMATQTAPNPVSDEEPTDTERDVTDSLNEPTSQPGEALTALLREDEAPFARASVAVGTDLTMARLTESERAHRVELVQLTDALASYAARAAELEQGYQVLAAQAERLAQIRLSDAAVQTTQTGPAVSLEEFAELKLAKELLREQLGAAETLIAQQAAQITNLQVHIAALRLAEHKKATKHGAKKEPVSTQRD